jgi:uncharacterized SAM-binding protein YcdF (DUF218 family)
MRRLAPWSLTVVVIVVVVIAVPFVRNPVFNSVGELLVAQDPTTPSDLIVVAPDVADAGVLEASDLVHLGIARRVVLLGDPLTELAHVFSDRGVTYEDEFARLIRLFHALGIERVELIRLPAGGTEDTAHFLQQWCSGQSLRSVTVVTSADHSRRFRRVLRRTMHRTGVRVFVTPSRYSGFVPDQWWQHRGTLRTGIVELQKLCLDVLRHPFS